MTVVSFFDTATIARTITSNSTNPTTTAVVAFMPNIMGPVVVGAGWGAGAGGGTPGGPGGPLGLGEPGGPGVPDVPGELGALGELGGPGAG